MGTRLRVVDNSGGKIVECIRIFHRLKSKVGYAGDCFLGALKSVTPNKKLKKGDIVRCIIGTTRKGLQRLNGVTVSFEENCAIVVNPKNIPVGSRLLGPVMLELREKGYLKVVSMATVSV